MTASAPVFDRLPARATRPGAAYAGMRDATVTPRQAEYRIFARITHRLSEAAAAREAGDGLAHPRLLEALHDNLRLWLSLAADLAGDGNRLPQELRAGLLSLAAYVERRTAEGRGPQGDPASAAREFVDINTAVMKGLRSQSERD
jgi:flagellar protein FlaF